MFTRIVTVSLVALLMVPVVTLTRLDNASPSPWGNVTVAAKSKPHHGHKQKKHKKHRQSPQKPQTPAINGPARQQITRTFSSTERIAVPDDFGRNFATDGKSSPYPSTIDVSGFANGVITDVNLTLNDVTHTLPADGDILLTSGDGHQALVMSDAGGATDIAKVDLTLDDEAATALPKDMVLTSGSFRPANFEEVPDLFDTPAPAPNGNVDLSAFDGANPNGTWQLWVMDDAAQDFGEIGGGWSLEITAAVDVPAQAQAQRHPKSTATKHVQPAVPRPEARRSEG